MYLLACSVVMLVAMYQGLRTFIDTSDIRALHKRMHSPIWLHMLNRHASLPFLPWPDYREGYSADLAVALHEMLKNAREP